MQRITITIDDDLLAALDGHMQRKGYESRSETLRDLIRATLAGENVRCDERAPCVAAFSYVYDHEKHDLVQKLVTLQHDRHDLSVASLHVHLDGQACLEVSVLRGLVGNVRRLTDEIASRRGVHYAHLHLVPNAIDNKIHSK